MQYGICIIVYAIWYMHYDLNLNHTHAPNAEPTIPQPPAVYRLSGGLYEEYLVDLTRFANRKLDDKISTDPLATTATFSTESVIIYVLKIFLILKNM